MHISRLLTFFFLLAIKTSAQELTFCNEQVPISSEKVFKQFITIYKTIGKQQNINNLRKKAENVFPLVESILDSYNIPADFKYLMITESNATGNCASSVGATGWWQLMSSATNQMGFKTVYNGIDIRKDLKISTHIAARYINWLYTNFRSWTLVAAAYNFGIGNILKTIKKQGTRNYYYMQLNKETGTYVYKILVYKYLLGNSLVLKNKINSRPLYNNTKDEKIKIENYNPILLNNPDSVAFVEQNQIVENVFSTLTIRELQEIKNIDKEKVVKYIKIEAIEDMIINEFQCADFRVLEENEGIEKNTVIKGCRYKEGSTYKIILLYESNIIGELLSLNKSKLNHQNGNYLIAEGFRYLLLKNNE